MMKKLFFAACGVLIAVAALIAQGRTDIVDRILKSAEPPVIAIPDFRGAGGAHELMGAFNETLFRDIQESAVFRMAPKSMYPLEVPQRPQDFRPPLPPSQPVRRNQPPPQPIRQGPWLTDWSGPPVNANYLAFGYAAEQNGQLVLFGWLYNVTLPDIANAQLIGKLYFGSLDAAGASKVAHEFAADILEQFGATSLAGTKIYFVSDRGGRGNKEIWVMDYDGANQRQITRNAVISTMPGVSPDGTRLAYTSYLKGNPAIVIHSLETNRILPFYNQVASMNATPCFTPDGQHILFSSTLTGIPQIYRSNLDGSGLQRISHSTAIEVEPKVNPKTGREIVFVSGRSGPQQIYRMNIDGADVQRLTTGEGAASNPAWHPDGQHIAFAWTRGFEPGNWNIFIMDVATREVVQLTHGRGRNENPTWSPDGRHIVFSSNRSGTTQIWTMLADGTQARRLTTQGRNEMPVWSK
ncbi:MAG: translocation protein TolB [Bryobacteraceae bacterium]